MKASVVTGIFILFQLSSVHIMPNTCNTHTTTTIAPEQILDECLLNGTLKLRNPDPDRYSFITAVQSFNQSECNASFGTSNATAIVTGCDIFQEIEITFSEDSTIRTGIGLTVGIFCKDIADEGVTKDLVQKFTPILHVTSIDSVTPTFGISSALRLNSYTDPPAITAVLTTPVYWTIDLPADYYGRPIECWAYSGTEVNVASLNKKLHVDGCSQDLDIVQHFSQTNSAIVGDVRRYWAIMYTFKFYDSDFLTLTCNVALCKEEADCEMVCRKRRDVAMSTPAKMEDVVQTSVTLRLINPELGLSGSGTAGLQGSILAVALVTLPNIIYLLNTIALH